MKVKLSEIIFYVLVEFFFFFNDYNRIILR